VKKAAEHGPKDKGLDDMRVMLDYRCLNAKSSPDRYSICGMEECITYQKCGSQAAQKRLVNCAVDTFEALNGWSVV
jgi:hypothetical protein